MEQKILSSNGGIDIAALQKEMELSPSKTEEPGENLELPWQNILELTNGRDAVGNPFASAVLSEDSILEDGQLLTVQNIYLDDAEFQIRMSGGCIAMHVDLPKKNKQQYTSIRKMCKEWFEKLMDPNFANEILTMTITPLLLEGKLYMVLDHLILADGYETEHGYRLIFAFDNLQTTPVMDADIDFAAILTDIDAELARKEEELLEGIAEAERITAEAEYNPFDDIIKDRMNNPLKSLGEKADEEVVNSGIRVSREEEEDE